MLGKAAIGGDYLTLPLIVIGACLHCRFLMGVVKTGRSEALQGGHPALLR